MPDTVLSIFHIVTHVILTTTQWGWYGYDPPFYRWGNRSVEQWNHLLKTVMGFEPRPLDSNIHVPTSSPFRCLFPALRLRSLHRPLGLKPSSFFIPVHPAGELFTLFTPPLHSLMPKSRTTHSCLPLLLYSHSTLFLGFVWVRIGFIYI